MKILELKDVVRKDFPIYYRRLYSGMAVIELLNKSVESALAFQIETKPAGDTEVTITSLEEVDYPLLPLKKELKKFIGELDSTGSLPD